MNPILMLKFILSQFYTFSSLAGLPARQMALRIISPLPIHPLQQNPLLRRRRLSPSLPLSAGARLTAATFAEAEEQPIPSIPLDGDDTLLVQELEELPEQWRRSKVAWLCKQLPGQKPGALTRLLNAQRKWISQQDVTYLVVHCLRIRENDSAFKVPFLFLATTCLLFCPPRELPRENFICH